MRASVDGQVVDLEMLREWLAEADGMTVEFPAPLEPHQLRLMESLGVTPTFRPTVRTMIERVPEDGYLQRHLGTYRALMRDGWATTALRDRATGTVILLACKEDRPT